MGIDMKGKVGPVPKWLIFLIMVMIVIFVCVLAFRSVFAGGEEKKEQDDQSVILTVPDAPEKATDDSMLASLEKNAVNANNNTSRYWDNLGDEDDMSGGMGAEVYLDPNIYSEHEIKLIRRGQRSKESIDAEHAERDRQKREEEERKAREAASAVKPMTREQSDSLYFARMDRVMERVQKYANPVSGAAEEVIEPEPEPSIDIASLRSKPETMPVESFQNDGIISSLSDSGGSSGMSRAGSMKPVKATFLKSGKITSGNRVIIRLMEDLTLADGMVIPANTHITGTCNFKGRLKINVSMLHYNGSMFPVDISVYDNDGTEGLYCPLAYSSKKKEKQLSQAAQTTLQSLGNIAGTVLMHNPFLGSMTGANLNAIAGSLGDDGVITINVTSGYEFYVYETVKKDGDANRS